MSAPRFSTALPPATASSRPVLQVFVMATRSSSPAGPVADAAEGIGGHWVQRVHGVHRVQRVRRRTSRDVAAATRPRRLEPGAWSPVPQAVKVAAPWVEDAEVNAQPAPRPYRSNHFDFESAYEHPTHSHSSSGHDVHAQRS